MKLFHFKLKLLKANSFNTYKKLFIKSFILFVKRERLAISNWCFNCSLNLPVSFINVWSKYYYAILVATLKLFFIIQRTFSLPIMIKNCKTKLIILTSKKTWLVYIYIDIHSLISFVLWKECNFWGIQFLFEIHIEGSSHQIMHSWGERLWRLWYKTISV